MSSPNDSSSEVPPPHSGHVGIVSGETPAITTTSPPSPSRNNAAPKSPPPNSPSTVKVSSTNVGAVGGSSSRGILGGGDTRPPVVSGGAPAILPPAQQETASPRRKQPEIPGTHTFGSPTRVALSVGGLGGSGSGAVGGGGSPQRKRFRGGGNGGGGASCGSRLVPTDPTQNGSFPCSVDGCTRIFSSIKALHGHMRAHRDRGWTGTFAPPTFSTDQLSHTFKNTMDIVGGRAAADGGDAVEEEQVDVVVEEEQVAVEEVVPEVQAGINILAEEGPEVNILAEDELEDRLGLNLNELPREEEDASTSGQIEESHEDQKLFDLNEFPSPDDNQEN